MDADLDLLVPARRRVEAALALADENLHPLFDVVRGEHLLVQLNDHRVGHNRAVG